MPAPPRRSTSTAWCASTTCAPIRRWATSRSIWSTSTIATARATRSPSRVRDRVMAIGKAAGGNAKVVEVPPGPPVLSPIVAEVYGPDYAGQIEVAKKVRAAFEGTADILGVDDIGRRRRRQGGAARQSGQGGAARRGAEGHRRHGAPGADRRGRDAGARRRRQVRNPGAHHPARRAPDSPRRSC